MLGIRRRIKSALRSRNKEEAQESRSSREPVVPAIREDELSDTNFTVGAAVVSKQAPNQVPETGQSEVNNGEKLKVSELENSGDYWGPIDNESAREKAAGKELEIDRNECIGCGTCVENEEAVFFLNDDECKAYVIAQEGDMELVQDAIDACPVTCISWQ